MSSGREKIGAHCSSIDKSVEIYNTLEICDRVATTSLMEVLSSVLQMQTLLVN